MIEVKLMREGVSLPTKATDGSACVDLRLHLVDDEKYRIVEGQKAIEILPNETVKVSAGFAVHIKDPCLVGLIFPRSGLSTKKGIVLANTVGVIDSDYTGEIFLMLRNQSVYPQTIEINERVAQMTFMPVAMKSFKLVEAFSEQTERGDGGFGSSGTK